MSNVVKPLLLHGWSKSTKLNGGVRLFSDYNSFAFSKSAIDIFAVLNLSFIGDWYSCLSKAWMFEPKMMDLLVLFCWWMGHLLLAIKEVFISLAKLLKLLCTMSNVRGWVGAPRCKCKNVTTPECWLLVVVGTHILNVLSAKRSPHLNALNWTSNMWID